MADHKAVLQWQNDGLLFNGTVDDRDDLPLTIGWRESDDPDGLSPMGVLLGALAACTGMDVISILQKKRQNVTFFEVAVEGEQDDEHPRVYRDVTIVYRVGGQDIDEQAVARAIELSVTKYCPVNGTLREVADIQTRYEIVETPVSG